MKIILPYLFSIITCSAFGQAEMEHLSSLPANTKTFGQKFKVEYHGHFNNYKFVSVKDSVSGITKVVPNKGQLDTWSESPCLFNGQFCIHFSETTPPPLLDSLEDGLYAFYYTPFPYADGDTIKMRSDAIYALIPVKNFQVNGTVKWYYPNGNLAQQSEYVNNEKQGLTIVNSLDVSNTRMVVREQKNYDHHVEQGPFSTLYNMPIEKDGKLLATIPFVEQGTKVNGKHTGDYSVTTNGEVFISGTFKDGEPIDHWIINQWAVKGKKLVLLPNMEFEINDERTPVFHDFIPRNLYPSEEYLNRYGAFSSGHEYLHENYAIRWLSYMKLTYLVEHWDSKSYYFGKNRYQSNISEIPNCLGLLDKKLNGKLRNSLNSYASDLVDSTGKSYSIEQVKKQCGTVYDFKTFKCYYPNGKLYFDFDFEDSKNLQQSPVYRPNGKLLNEVVYSEKDWNYHYIEYDTTGRVENESIYDLGGKLLKKLDFREKRIIDGDTLTSLRGSSWFYLRSEIMDSTLNKDILQMLEIDYKTDQIIKSNYYNPATRSGKYYQFEPSTNTSRTVDYQYTTSYDSTVFTVKYKFLDLDIENHSTISGHYESWFFSNLSYYGISFSLTPLYQNGKPVNAKFLITLDHSGKLKKLSYLSKKGVYQISLPQQNYSLFNEFLNTISNDLKITELVNREISYRLDEKNRKNAELKTLSFSVKDGLVHDSIIKKSISNYYISKYFIQNDSLVKYNDFDQWYNAFNRGYSSDKDFERNWISEILSHNAVKQTQLLLYFDSNGDTAYYYFEDHINKAKESYTNTSDEIEKWNSVDDNIRHFYIKYPHGNYFLYDQAKQTCTYFNKDSSLNTEFLLEDDLLTTINRFDNQGMLAEETFVKNGYATQTVNYYNGFLASKIDYRAIDSVIPELDRLPKELDKQLVRFYLDTLEFYDYIYDSPRNHSKQDQRDEVIKYQNEVVVESGALVNYRKSGNWNYSYPAIPKFQMEFRDTSYRYETKSEYERKSYTGKYRQLDSLGRIQKSGTFYEFSSEYICTNQDYTEQYVVQYDTWNYESTKGKSIYAVNYYPNGNKMNEGNLVDGKPEGLWLWYHSDGLLYEIGKYKAGIREGRWISGDLSKIRFMGETCLDPNSSEFKNLVNTITVFVTYYENGLVSYSENHELSTE